MMKYEASRPDATATLGGTLQNVTCSKPGVQPWTNVTYPTAVQACEAVGARLCTEAEWQQMCVPETTYPVTGPATTGTSDFVFIEAEDAFANTTIGTPAVDRAWTKVASASMQRDHGDAGAGQGVLGHRRERAHRRPRGSTSG